MPYSDVCISMCVCWYVGVWICMCMYMYVWVLCKCLYMYKLALRTPVELPRCLSVYSTCNSVGNTYCYYRSVFGNLVLTNVGLLNFILWWCRLITLYIYYIYIFFLAKVYYIGILNWCFTVLFYGRGIVAIRLWKSYI